MKTPSLTQLHSEKRPVYALFRPWSHTDKRHVIKIMGELHHSEEQLIEEKHRLDDPTLHGCLLEPMTSLDFIETVKSDDERIKRIVQDGYGDLKNADLPFLSVSWTKNTPEQLRIESRRMALRRYAFEQCDLASQFPHTKALHSYFILTLLEPETAILSPGAQKTKK